MCEYDKHYTFYAFVGMSNLKLKGNTKMGVTQWHEILSYFPTIIFLNISTKINYIVKQLISMSIAFFSDAACKCQDLSSLAEIWLYLIWLYLLFNLIVFVSFWLDFIRISFRFCMILFIFNLILFPHSAHRIFYILCNHILKIWRKWIISL